MTRGFTKLISFISYPATALTRRFNDIAAWKQVVKEEATRVPTFYGADIGSGTHIGAIAFAVSFIFALFSLIPSFLIEWQVFWLRLALVNFIVTASIPVLYYARPTLTARFIPLFLGIYILGRITMFTLGFTTLQGLSQAALSTIHWPKFILIFIGN